MYYIPSSAYFQKDRLPSCFHRYQTRKAT